MRKGRTGKAVTVGTANSLNKKGKGVGAKPGAPPSPKQLAHWERMRGVPSPNAKKEAEASLPPEHVENLRRAFRKDVKDKKAKL